MYNELINSATKEYPFLIKHINVKYIPHFHQETEIVYVLDGELTFTLGMYSYIIKKGDICIIPSRLIHNLYTESYSETYVMKLYSIVDFSNIHLENHILTKKDSGYEKLYNYIYDIINENEKKEEYYKLAVNIHAENIFLFILRETKYHKNDSKIKMKHITENEFLSSINSFLESHYNEDFSLFDIAKHSNYTKSYFCRHFKRITGITFWEYFTMFRLEKSLQYIKASPKENITVIADRSGFKNVRSFNNAFKNFYRYTPSEYRKMMNQIEG